VPQRHDFNAVITENRLQAVSVAVIGSLIDGPQNDTTVEGRQQKCIFKVHNHANNKYALGSWAMAQPS